MKHIAKNNNANEIVINIANNAINNNDTAKCMLLKNKYRYTMQLLRKIDIQLWLNVRAIANSNSAQWGTKSCGITMLEHCKLDELELRNKAKSTLRNIMLKKKYPFTIDQMKITIDCCTSEELLRCCNNSHYNTDKLFYLVGKKASKYNR